jgi:hypothetical protein
LQVEEIDEESVADFNSENEDEDNSKTSIKYGL